VIQKKGLRNMPQGMMNWNRITKKVKKLYTGLQQQRRIPSKAVDSYLQDYVQNSIRTDLEGIIKKIPITSLIQFCHER
jgi:hypothetical protein